MLKKYDDLTEKIKNLNSSSKILLFMKQCYRIVFQKKNGLKLYNYFINMTEEDISQELRSKQIKQINNYFIK